MAEESQALLFSLMIMHVHTRSSNNMREASCVSRQQPKTEANRIRRRKSKVETNSKLKVKMHLEM
jgi:hypothetical protein